MKNEYKLSPDNKVSFEDTSRFSSLFKRIKELEREIRYLEDQGRHRGNLHMSNPNKK